MAVYKRRVFIDFVDKGFLNHVGGCLTTFVSKNDSIWLILNFNSLTNSNPLFVSDRRVMSSTFKNCKIGRPSRLDIKRTI